MDESDIGRAIRARRKLLALTQSDVAGLAGVGRSTLSDLENGNGSRGVTLKNVVAVCAVLGLALHVDSSSRQLRE